MLSGFAGGHSDRAAPAAIRIAPLKRAPLNLRELIEYHQLLYFLTWRILKLRYRQTALGAAWAIVQPFLTMVVFSVVFGRLAGLNSEGAPYPVFSFAALVPWTYFANAVTQASNSLVENERMITKVYFPRLMLPLAAIVAGLVDLVIAFLVLLAMMHFYGVVPTVAAWTLPLFVLLAALTALGAGLWLSVLNVKYRDVRHALPFLIQFWLFATPVAYSSRLIPAAWRPLLGLNPMAGVVDGFRWALLGQTAEPSPVIMVSVGIVVTVLLSGLWYFRRMEQSFADVI
jgi:lipopolysaccharide transport system permease protein